MEPDRPEWDNPYAPPSSDVNAGQPPAAPAGQLAERSTRLVSHLVDRFLSVLTLIPAIISAYRSGAFAEGGSILMFREFVKTPLGVWSGGAWLGLLLVQAYLVATSGQSIAKRLFRIRIVKLDGSPVSLVSGVLVRNWLLLALQQITVLSVLLPLCDALFIFREDRRCLHDLLAGTKVVELAGATRNRVA